MIATLDRELLSEVEYEFYLEIMLLFVTEEIL
jgi:hypothetical protein